MAISSINFAKSSAGSFAHNDRTISPDYLIDDSKLNEVSCSADQAQAKLQELYAKAKEGYENTYQQKFQTKFENTHWEAAVNLNAHHTLKDVEELARAIEKETGFTTLQISIHRDEGKITEDGKKEKNYHAHINFFTLDQNNGKQLYRRSISNAEREKIRKEYQIPDGEKIPKHLTAVMDREKMSKLQDITALTLKMERGKKGSKAVRLDHRQYKMVAKEKEQLKEQIKAKDYSLKEMQSRIVALEGTEAELRKELHAQNREINKTKDLEAKEQKIKDLEAKLTQLEAENTQLKSIPKEVQKEFIQDPKIVQENSELRKEIAELKEAKTATVSNDTDLAKRQKETMWEVESAIKYLTPPYLPSEPVKKEELDAKAQEIAKLKARATPQFGMKMIDVCCNAVGWPDKEKLSKLIASEMRKGVDVADDSLKLGYKLHDFKDRAIEAVKSAVKSTKTTLESIFTKIAGKSLSEVENERVEAKNQRLQEIEELREKLGHRSELTKDIEKPFSFKDFEKEQEKEKEAEKTQSKGLNFSR